jgi:hypothetical protein
VNPTPQTKSAFLAHYDPSVTVSRLSAPHQMLTAASDGAGSLLPWDRSDVVHSRDYQWALRPGPASYVAITGVLFNETKRSLIASGAAIVSQQLANGRFVLIYRSGRTTRSIVADWRESDHATSLDDRLRLSVKEHLRL